jgi:hypothetical protein
MALRERHQKSVAKVDTLTLAEAVAAAKFSSSEGRLQLCDLMAWAACPDTTTPVCDAISSAWLGNDGPMLEISKGLPKGRLEDSFCGAALT